MTFLSCVWIMVDSMALDSGDVSEDEIRWESLVARVVFEVGQGVKSRIGGQEAEKNMIVEGSIGGVRDQGSCWWRVTVEASSLRWTAVSMSRVRILKFR
jgi:hypothetical protein